MPKLEAITSTASAEIPMTDSPGELLDGLKTVVKPAITEHFNDVLWVLYFDCLERMAFESEPRLKALMSRLFDAEDIDREASRPNIMVSPELLARNQAGVARDASPLHRVSYLQTARFVALPAHNVPKGSNGRQPDVDVANGISFDGSTFVETLASEGVAQEVVHRRAELPFGAIRLTDIGGFFVSKVLE